ncbi:MAG: hypothetical protein JXA52_01815 [Planctomycetes bacterium]|nr:hypothetical protein [Planctomycetota bacterium]
MNVHLRSFQDIVVLEIDGYIDNNTVPVLFQSLAGIISSGCHTVIMGLEHTKIVLSTGIGFFIEAHDMIEAANGHLILADVPHDINYMLCLTEIDSFFGEMPSLSRALLQVGISENDLIPGLPSRRQRVSSLYPRTESKGPPKHKSEILRLKKLREKQEAPHPRHGMSDEMLKKLIHTYLPSRQAVDLVNYFISGKRSSMQISRLAAALHQSPRITAKIMKKLENRGVMKHIGAEIYNYAPTKELREQLEEFFIRWHRASEHRELLKLVISAENGESG